MTGLLSNWTLKPICSAEAACSIVCIIVPSDNVVDESIRLSELGGNVSYPTIDALDLPFSFRPILRVPGTIISALGMAGVGLGPAILGAVRESQFCPKPCLLKRPFPVVQRQTCVLQHKTVSYARQPARVGYCLAPIAIPSLPEPVDQASLTKPCSKCAPIQRKWWKSGLPPTIQLLVFRFNCCQSIRRLEPSLSIMASRRREGETARRAG